MGDTYQINTIDFNQPTQFLKVGDTIKGTRFKIAKFVKKHEPNKYGTNVDVSELTLEQERNQTAAHAGQRESGDIAGVGGDVCLHLGGDGNSRSEKIRNFH